MGLAIILFLGGLVIIAAVYLWSRQRQNLNTIAGVEQLPAYDLPLASSDDAVLVSREHGQLVYVNPRARNWLGMNGGDPNLEQVARLAQPVDSFLELFAVEGQSSFQLDGRWVEASSHRIPAGGEMRTVVVMRELTANTTYPEALDLSLAINIINEIGETVNASMSIEQTLQALMAIVNKSIPSNAGEICLWNEQQRILNPRGWAGDSAYVLMLMEAGGCYAYGEGLTGWMAQYHKPVLVEDARRDTSIMPKLRDKQPYQSFVGVPLILGERFIGTFELASTKPGHFRQSDMALLQAISKQVATAIYNAELYSEQARRIEDMSSLQEIPQKHQTTDNAENTDYIVSVYYALNERIAHLLGADMAGILMYEAQRQALLPELPFYGLHDQIVRTYNIPLTEGSPQQSLWQRESHWISNDLSDEPSIEVMGLKTLVDSAGMYNTVIMPMELGERRIGVIQVGNKRTEGGFTLRDVQNLRLLSAQAAVIVENLRLFQREQRQQAEMRGMQEITFAIGAFGRETDFYTELNNRIARLMDIAISGILLYDENTYHLVAQLPFYGVDNALIEQYKIKLEPGSALYEIWVQDDYWFSNNVSTDRVVFAAGLEGLAETLGVKKTLMAVMSIGGRRIGAVQVSNKNNGEDFSEKDARLLAIFATQAAAIIENARLYSEMMRHADESDSLRRIAELAGAVMMMDETFTPVLTEVARLTESPLVFINALDQQLGTLTTYPRWTHGLDLDTPIVHDIYGEGLEQGVAITHRALVSEDLSKDRRAPTSYVQFARKFNIQRALIAPLVVGEQSLGEIVIANRPDAPYDDDDKNLLNAIAVQIAAALDRVRMYESAGQNLIRREQELDAIARVTNELAITLDLDKVLDVIRHEAGRVTGADGSTVALLVNPERWKDANQPEFDRRLGENNVLNELAEIEQQAIMKRTDPILVSDYIRSSYDSAPVGARSAVAVPILYADDVVGVIHVYHNTPSYFDERAARFLLTLAAKASLGYGNALRYQEQIDRSNLLRRRVDQLNQIFELGQMLQSNIDPEFMMEAIAHAIQQSVGFNIVVVLLLEQDLRLRRVTQAGLPLDVFESSLEKTISLPEMMSLMKEDYRISESYFFPVQRAGDWANVENLGALATSYDGNRTLSYRGENPWREGDMLVVPLMGSSGNLLGVMVLDRPEDDQRPDRTTIETLEIFAHNAATVIENNNLYRATVRSAEQEALLSEVMEALGGTLNIPQIIQSLALGIDRLLNLDRMSVVLTDAQQEQGFNVYRMSFDEDNQLEIKEEQRPSLFGTALGRTFDEGQEYLYRAGDAEIRQYVDLRTWYQSGERTSLILPLSAGGTRLGAMHLGGNDFEATRVQELYPMLKRLTNVASVAIQNARLFDQTTRQRTFTESVFESIQQGIVVLDNSGRILSVNNFMRQNYGWDQYALRQDLFAYRPNWATILAPVVNDALEKGQQSELLRQRISSEDETLVRNFYIYPLGSQNNVRGVVLMVEDMTARALLEEDIEKRANQLAALTEVSSRITSTLNRQEVVALAMDEISKVIDYDTLTFWRRQADFMALESVRGFTFKPRQSDFGKTITMRVADMRRAMKGDTTPDTYVDIGEHERLRKVVDTQQVFVIDHLQGIDPLPGEEGLQSWMGIPLVNKGDVVGMIAIGKSEPRAYNEQAAQVAFNFANQVAVALENADLFDETQRRTRRLDLLNRVSVSLAQSLDSENILEVALREIAQTLNAEKSRALLIERESLQARVVVEHPRGDSPPNQIVELKDSATYQHIRRNVETLIFADTSQLAPNDPILQEIAPRNVTAYILIPLAVAGQVIGLFELDVYSGPRSFDPEQIELGQIIANQAAIAVQNANLLEQTLVRTRELETLLEAAQATSLTFDLDEVFRSVAELMLQALDMDDCAILIWDDVSNTLEVQIDYNRNGDQHRVMPPGMRLNLAEYPAKLHALRQRDVLTIHVHDEDPLYVKELEELRAADDTARMLVPLVVRDQAIGLIQVELQTIQRIFSHRERRLAQALGAQAAIAIENARLSTETASQFEELFFINDLSRAISSSIDIDEMIQVVRDQIVSVMGAQELYLALYDPDNEIISFPLAVRDGMPYEIPSRPLAMDEVSFIVRFRRPLILGGGDLSLDEVRRSLGIINGEGDIKSYLGVPIVAGDQVMGVLAVRDSRNRVFGLNDQRILTTVGSQMGAAIQNARLFERIRTFAAELEQRVQERTLELQQERDRIDTLYRITAELQRTLDIDRVLNRALEMVANAVHADEGTIMLIDPITDKLYSRAALQLSNGRIADNGRKTTQHAEGLATWLIQNDNRAIVLKDLQELDWWRQNVGDASDNRSALAVLLETNDDIQGVMVLMSKRVSTFTDPHLKLVSAAASQVAAAINNADLYHLIRDQAERLGMLLRTEQEEAEKNSAILEGIADGVMLADSEGRVVLFNSAAERILELPRTHVTGQPLSKLVGLYGGSASAWAQAINDWAQDPNLHQPGQFLAERIDLGKRFVSVHLSPVYSDEQFLGTVSVFRDITKEVEVDLVKSQFVSNVSHELRTPMTSIKGYVDLLMMGAAGELSETQQRFLGTIKNNADRLSNLVNDLLNISKIDTGNESLKLELVDIDEVVSNVVTNLSGRAEHERKNIDVQVMIEPKLPPIQADPLKLTQIITNIVDNAFNYTYEGGSIEIKAVSQSDKQHVLISVKDSGIGIPEEFRERIWERFERNEEHALVMDVPGTGLGLPIVKNLVDMHGGRVWFESEVGVGTTFFVLMPVRQSELETSAAGSNGQR
jgi:PAS domain S-box-containing protein